MVADPTLGHAPLGERSAILVTVSGVVVAVLAAGCAGRCRRDERTALLLGISSGVFFGLVAGLLKLTVVRLASTSQPLDLLGSWTTLAVVVLGTAGVVTTQRGYTAARMSASMPVLNVTDVLVALLFGAVVFDQVPAHDPGALLGEVLAAGLMILGLRRLALDDDFTPERSLASDTGGPGRSARTVSGRRPGSSSPTPARRDRGSPGPRERTRW